MKNGLDAILMGLNGSHLLRNVLLDQLTDDELDFSPGGENKTVRELLRDLAELQHMYAQSLVSGEHDWTYQVSDDGQVVNLQKLRTWFEVEDAEMEAIFKNLSLEDLKRPVDRSDGVVRSVEQQLMIYTQAMMIFFGKAVVYLRAMDKPLPPSLAHYIG